MIVVAVRSLAGVACVDVCELIQPVIETMAEDVCRVSHTHNSISAASRVVMQPMFSEQSQQARQALCSFIGKLFMDASYSSNTELV